MNKQWLRIGARAAVMVCLAAFALATAAAEGLPIKTLAIGAHRFVVQVATTDFQRQTGLMYVRQLTADHGMWFVFHKEQRLTFWMKNTLIPLDILYFDSARRLVAEQLDALPCKSDPCAIYPSYVRAQYVLELPAGTARRAGLRVGDVATSQGQP